MADFPRHKRVLLLGPTGVDKGTAALRLSKHLEGFGHSFRFVDFENEFLKNEPGVRSWTHFLAQDMAIQTSTWRRAWESFKTSISSETTILALHATYISSVLGLRFPIHLPSICADFAPTLIVSLIDDVYCMWHRTETRAGGRDDKGRPSFEQLLVARRAEQTMGDLISSHTAPMAKHVLCATGNNLDALANLIIFDADVTYLSFPISAPRKLQKTGDSSFVQLINKAHQLAAAEMHQDHSRCFISPLAIDELPIVFRHDQEQSYRVSFNCALDRWRLDELWGSNDLVISPPEDKTIVFPKAQIGDAIGAIRTDVGWRDRRLVMQSKSLAIVSPKPPKEDRITRGVAEEIETAVMLGTVCYYWQNPDWDSGDFVGKAFGSAGSMGIGHTQAFVSRLDSLEALIRARP
ncbi:DNA polymerase III delta prime subunit [Bradyrhizobium diazoefficiens]